MVRLLPTLISLIPISLIPNTRKTIVSSVYDFEYEYYCLSLNILIHLLIYTCLHICIYTCPYRYAHHRLYTALCMPHIYSIVYCYCLLNIHCLKLFCSCPAASSPLTLPCLVPCHWLRWGSNWGVSGDTCPSTILCIRR